MSYILDALKRAESERERGNVPGLHAQPAPAAFTDAGATGKLPPLAWLGIGVAVAALGLLGWRAMTRDAVQPDVAASAAAPVAVPAVTPTPTAPPAAPPVAPVVVAVPAAAPPPSPAAPAATNPAPARKVAVSSMPAASSRKEEAAAKVPPSASAPAASAPTEARVPTLAELPAELRGQLPALIVSGSTYSDNPAYRMLIVNGQVFHEGERPAAEVTLERIGARSAVLQFRGTRYSIPY